MAVKTGKKQKKGRFKPGQSGNPKGRPKGSLNKSTLAAKELLNGESEAITRKCIEMALEGNVQALKLCMERLVPVCKEPPINAKIKIPDSLEEIPLFTAHIIKLVTKGKISADEGEKLSKLVESHIRAIGFIEKITSQNEDIELSTEFVDE